MRLVLGSASPRRRELLGLLGVPFVVRIADVDESVRLGERWDAYLERVTEDKRAAVSRALRTPRPAVADGTDADETGSLADAAVLVADTSVVVDGDVLGKPLAAEAARAMVTRLAGRAHDVATRFVLGRAGEAPLAAETVVTRVFFRPLDAAAVDAYVATGEGLDKAGGYAIQGVGAHLVARVEGSYTGVVGLPLAEVAAALARAGLTR